MHSLAFYWKPERWGVLECSLQRSSAPIPWPHRPERTPQSPRDQWTPRWSRTFQTPAWTGDTRWGEVWSPGAPGSSEGCPCSRLEPAPTRRYGGCCSLPSRQHILSQTQSNSVYSTEAPEPFRSINIQTGKYRDPAAVRKTDILVFIKCLDLERIKLLLRIPSYRESVLFLFEIHSYEWINNALLSTFL